MACLKFEETMDPKVIESMAAWKDPLGYPWSTYLWVVGIACLAGVVKHLNGMERFRIGRLCIDLVTASFVGVVAFWLCKAKDIDGPMMAVAIALAGVMGNRFWTELENVWRIRFGIKPKTNDDEVNK
jgi:hypothetical protein